MCKPFSYGGCQGNANNFQTKKECVWQCGGEGSFPRLLPAKLLMSDSEGRLTERQRLVQQRSIVLLFKWNIVHCCTWMTMLQDNCAPQTLVQPSAMTSVGTPRANASQKQSAPKTLARALQFSSIPKPALECNAAPVSLLNMLLVSNKKGI